MGLKRFFHPPAVLLFAAIGFSASGCHLQPNSSSPLLEAPSQPVSTGTGGSSGSSGGGSTGDSAPLPLSVTSISPTKGSFKSGELVTLTGTGFTARTRILVDGQPCPVPNILSSTQATCFLARHPEGPVKIRTYEYTAPATFFDQDFTYILDGYSLVSQFAGDETNGDIVDGTGTAALFYDISSSAMIGRTLYVLDYCNLRSLNLDTGQSATLVGTGFGSCDFNIPDGDFTTGAFYSPGPMAAVGNKLYVSEGSCIREIDLTAQTIKTVVGICASSGFLNSTVPTQVRFGGKVFLATDGTFLYASDTYNNMIRKISLADFSTTTLAGQRTSGFADLTGTGAKFNAPYSITYLNGKLYVADYYNAAIRAVDVASGAVTTVAGHNGFSRSGGWTDGPRNMATVTEVTGMTTDGTDLYITQGTAVRRVVLATGEVRLLAGWADNAQSPGGYGNYGGMIYDAALGDLQYLYWTAADGIFAVTGQSVFKIQ